MPVYQLYSYPLLNLQLSFILPTLLQNSLFWLLAAAEPSQRFVRIRFRIRTIDDPQLPLAVECQFFKFKGKVNQFTINIIFMCQIFQQILRQKIRKTDGLYTHTVTVKN